MLYRFHVHRMLPAWRLAIRDGAGFPAATTAEQWTFTRARPADDTNADVRDAVEAEGFCLFKIGARFSDLDADLAQARPSTAGGKPGGN